MQILEILWYAFQILVGHNLILPLFLYLTYLACNRGIAVAPRPIQADYGIIVTAYKYTHSLPAVVDSLLKLNYRNYLIYVVADNCNANNLSFQDERVVILNPEAVLSSNVRSHFYAIHRFKRNHDRLTIIDSDNLVAPDFLIEMDAYFERGFSAVQGLRKPRNLDSTYACLDAARDIYYHFYDGRILFGIGSSATLSGSGMAFTTSLYRDCLENARIEGAGFDKVLQAEIVSRNFRIAFAEKAVVYDAKTSRPAELVNQRSRWLGTWFSYFIYSFPLMLRGLKCRSINQFLFGLTLLRPPLFIFLILSVIFLIINFLFNTGLEWLWLAGIVIFILGFILALRKSATDKRIYRSLTNIPRFMLLQIFALTKLLTKQKAPVSTKHPLP
ncbi:MAG TPA: glycosyltransferase [Sphingobacteriaceae bacterium]